MSRILLGVLLLLAALTPARAQSGWTPTRTPMSDPRWAPAFCLLAGGTQGLVVGGYSFPADRCLATADLFDPQTRRFQPCRGRLVVPRNFAHAVLLPNGQALVIGGYNTILGSLDSAELYDPATQTFHLLDSRLASPRELFTATTLTDGRVLIVGGFNTHRGRTQSTADLYDPTAQTFTPTGFAYGGPLRPGRRASRRWPRTGGRRHALVCSSACCHTGLRRDLRPRDRPVPPDA